MWSTDLEYYFSAQLLSSMVVHAYWHSVCAICRRSTDNGPICRFTQKYCDRFVMLACHTWYCSEDMWIQFRPKWWIISFGLFTCLVFMKKVVIVSPSVLNSTTNFPFIFNCTVARWQMFIDEIPQCKCDFNSCDADCNESSSLSFTGQWLVVVGDTIF